MADRHNPDADQVPRRLAYEAAHPGVRIICLAPAWQAIIPDGDQGETVITRYDLRKLLDKLDSLDAGAGLAAKP